MSDLAAATGNLDFGGHKGVNVADPGADQDAATKKYHEDNKYTDAEAVAAADASDKFIERGVENIIAAITTLKRTTTGTILNFLTEVTGNFVIATPFKTDIKSTTHSYVNTGGMITFPTIKLYGTDTNKTIGKINVVKLPGQTTSTLKLYIVNSAGSSVYVLNLEENFIDVRDLPIKDIKNHADATLFGTPRIIELLIGSTPYYFKVYPTKN